ncbi:unnamed protein product [Paramecium pentaurelia]|uniref:USP domain-containing protein n=1 Tax=Paramecium pentaurelia TaxID=43138 RepID=A0A8S1SNI7_9CILI|nr:unnamed protein product [Paramecium pentaurelia]
MIPLISSITNNQNFEDENEHKSLHVPLFPNKKKPLNDTQLKLSIKSSSLTYLRFQFKTILESNKRKRELEILILKDLMKVKTQTQYYGISQIWIQQYNHYLYNNGQKPDNLNNTNSLNYAVVNHAVWQFLKEEYNGFPEIICEPNYSRNNKKKQNLKNLSKGINPKILSYPTMKFHQQDSKMIHIIATCMQVCKAYQYVLRIITQKNNNNLNSIQKNKFISSYYELIQQIKSTNSPFKLNSLQSLINNQFHSKFQHDCHEFLLYLLGQIEDEIFKFYENTESNFINPIQQIFKGNLKSTIKSSVCQHKINQIEPFLILSLAISHLDSLESSLNDFFKEEFLRDYFCPRCKANCIKKLEILFTPQILIFQFTPTCVTNIKTITYPMDDMHFLNKTYRLKAFGVHIGTLQQGHYFSFGKRQHQWFLFNDEILRSSSKSQVLEQNAYILFYQINDIV